MQLQQKFIWQNEAFEVYADQNLHDQTVLDKSAPVEKTNKEEKENEVGESAETVSINSTRGKKEVEADFKCRKVAGN